MIEYRNPTAKEIRNFLEVREGNVNGIYHDSVASNVPTHGLGINFDKKNSTFIKAYISALNDAQGGNLFNSDKLVNHYVFSNGTWRVENGVQKTLVEEIMWLSSPEQTKNKPFESQIIDTILHLYTNSAANEYAFDTVVYRAFLGKSGISYGFNGIKDMFYDNVWEKLDLDARMSLYSTFYNGRWNNNIRDAIKLYTNDGTEYTGGILSDKQVVGKLSAWIQILYFSNTSNNKGIQNRCFYDANKFLGKDIDEPQSIINVSNFDEANIAIAFMNQNYEAIFKKLNSIPNYSSNPNDYIRDNFSSAVRDFLFYNNYKGSYDLNTLFEKWHLLTDLNINTKDGSTSYSTVTGTELKDLIFLTSNKDGSTAFAGGGNDVVFGNKDNSNILNGGAGHDTLRGGSKNDRIMGGDDDDHIWGGNGLNVLNGDGGDDTIYGGDDKDIINGGSGDDELHGYGGNDDIFGGMGRDYISAGSGYNKIYLGNDNSRDRVRVSGTGIDHIYGATRSDVIFSYLGLVSSTRQGKNMRLLYSNGKIAIVHNFYEKDNPEDPAPSEKGVPFLANPDGGLLGYSVPDGGYVDTGESLPLEDLPPVGEDTPPEMPEGPVLPPEEGGDTPPEEGEDTPPEEGEDTPADRDDDKNDGPVVPGWDPDAGGVPNSGGGGGSGSLWDIGRNVGGGHRLPESIGGAFGEAEITRSPLVLDLDGDGVETINREYSAIYFDHDGNSFAENTGWVGRDV